MLTPLAEALDASQFGGKAAQLAAAIAAALPVPTGYALDVDAMRRVADGDEAALAPLSVTPHQRWAVRSSAIGEDGAHASFAGMHLTLLHVSPPRVADAVRRVLGSAHTEAALTYRKRMGLDGAPRMAVVIQQMVRAEVAGVLFTRNPITGVAERVVEASWGLGESVVAGLVTPDHYRVAVSGEVLERRLGIKDLEVAWCETGGTEERPVDPDRQARLCLDDARLGALGDLARCVEQHREGGHDLEWAFAAGSSVPVLLQQRPITQAG